MSKNKYVFVAVDILQLMLTCNPLRITYAMSTCAVQPLVVAYLVPCRILNYRIFRKPVILNLGQRESERQPISSVKQLLISTDTVQTWGSPVRFLYARFFSQS